MKSVFALLCLCFVNLAWACPYCAGNTQGERDHYTTLILGLFIIAIYIPYWIIYRLIKKSRQIDAAQEKTP